MILTNQEIYFNCFFGKVEKRDGFFAQQAGTTFLTVKTFAGTLLARLSGIGPEHDVASKITGIRAINIFLNDIELSIKILFKNLFGTSETQITHSRIRRAFHSAGNTIPGTITFITHKRAPS